MIKYEILILKKIRKLPFSLDSQGFIPYQTVLYCIMYYICARYMHAESCFLALQCSLHNGSATSDHKLCQILSTKKCNDKVDIAIDYWDSVLENT